MVFWFVLVRPRVALHPGPRYAIEGRNFTFSACHVTGHPAPVVTWRKASGQLPQGRVRYNNSALQISNVRKDDSDFYFCSAVNLLGSEERRVLLVVSSLPRFTVKPPVKVDAVLGETLILNCSATGDPQPVISWKRQGAQLPTGRTTVLKEALIIKNITSEDAGNYTCVAEIRAGAFASKSETTANVQVVTPSEFEISFYSFMFFTSVTVNEIIDSVLTLSFLVWFYSPLDAYLILVTV